MRADGTGISARSELGTAIDLGDGIWQIPVPFPSPLRSTLVYLLETPTGAVLIDAGWDSDLSWEGLTAGVEASGHDVGAVEGVVLTHFHPDHTGLCAKLRDATGAWIAMHEDDYRLFDLMTSERGETWMDGQIAAIRGAGASPADLVQYREGMQVSPPATRESRPDRLLEDGQQIQLDGRVLRAISTPGHTPGHVCFALESANVVFTGDHVLQKTTPHVGNVPYPLEDRDALGEFLESQRRIAALGITRGFGAHGTPIEDLPGRAAQLRRHHAERLDGLCRDLDGNPSTLWQIAARMHWYRPWGELPVMGKQLALTEASAHLRHLVETGSVVRVPGAEPALFRYEGGVDAA